MQICFNFQLIVNPMTRMHQPSPSWKQTSDRGAFESSSHVLCFYWLTSRLSYALPFVNWEEPCLIVCDSFSLGARGSHTVAVGCTFLKRLMLKQHKRVPRQTHAEVIELIRANILFHFSFILWSSVYQVEKTNVFLGLRLIRLSRALAWSSVSRR